MKWQHSDRSKTDYASLQHPSLHAEKYDEAHDLWQARVTKGWRFYFKIDNDTYIITRIVPHPK